MGMYIRRGGDAGTLCLVLRPAWDGDYATMCRDFSIFNGATLELGACKGEEVLGFILYSWHYTSGNGKGL